MGCNSSKGIQVGNGGNKEGWSSFPLMRNLSRSFSMPPLLQPFRPSNGGTSESHSFHIVALTSSTYGVLGGMGDKKYAEIASSTEDEEEAGYAARNLKAGSDRKTASRVREPEVIDVWELLEDLEDGKGLLKEGMQPIKPRKRAKTHYAKSLSMPASRSEKEVVPAMDRRDFSVSGLPLVLERDEDNQSVFHKVSPTKRDDKRPPIAPSSRLRKGLFYGASLDEKADATGNDKRISAVSGRSFSHRSSGYCTPLEEFGSPCPSPRVASMDEDGWCLVAKSSRKEECVKSRKSFELEEGARRKNGYTRINKQEQKQEEQEEQEEESREGEICYETKKPGLSLLESFEERCPPGGEERVVLYFTSLRGIRKTYEQCKGVRLILEGFFVAIDERDVSMHSEFRQELKDLMLGTGVPCSVPRLFVRGRYIGGADEVMQLNENGVMAELLAGLPRVCSPRKACEGCGGVRFIPCLECSGSCKVLDADDQVVRCSDCNENGLVRCPVCY